MSKILLTFLGTGNYQPCGYRFLEEASDEVTFFSAAAARHLQPDMVVVLQTKEATIKHGSVLAAELGHFRTKVVPIPEGRNEAELWSIFSALTEHVPEHCILHLDITHGFRSLPMLGFIGLNYLRITRKVTIGGIHYGAWEARDKETNVAPVFDFTAFLTLLDWTTAADQFLSTGSASRLGNLLQSAHQALWKNPQVVDKSQLPKRLKNLGGCIQQASEGLRLLRTGQLKRNSQALTEALDTAEEEAALHASPFLEIIGPVKESLTRFKDTDLATLRDLVGWLAEREQTAAALTLASEWITSYVMIWCGNQIHHTGAKKRIPYSMAISRLETQARHHDDDLELKVIEVLKLLQTKIPCETLESLKSVASQIRAARNDLNHAGFNDHPASAKTLLQSSREIASSLTKLPIPY